MAISNSMESTGKNSIEDLKHLLTKDDLQKILDYMKSWESPEESPNDQFSSLNIALKKENREENLKIFQEENLLEIAEKLISYYELADKMKQTKSKEIVEELKEIIKRIDNEPKIVAIKKIEKEEKKEQEILINSTEKEEEKLETEIYQTIAYHITTDEENGYDNKDDENSALTTNEMKRLSKNILKFLNNESFNRQERREIRLFIKTITNIEKTDSNINAVENSILNYFNNNLNKIESWNKKDQILIDWLKISEKDSENIVKLWKLYYQAMIWENPTFRRLCDIIQQEGSIRKIKTNFDDSMKQSKENKKYVKQKSKFFEWEDINSYGIWKKLNYKNEDLAKAKAYITQISVEKREDQNTIINAITDFDFDWFITHKDASSKTWLQIKNIISAEWEKKSLDNILSFANNTRSKLNIDLPEITRENVLSRPTYLLFIQNTLKNPSFDISDIIRYWDKAVENVYNLSEASINVVNNKTNKIINELKKLWIPVEAWLKDIVSTSILKAYNESAFWIWIPLDEFIKGLSFNVWSAAVPTGPECIGINIWRNGKINLWEWREATWWVSWWTSIIFIPMWSANVWITKTFENKKQSTSLDIKTNKKFELSWHAIVMPGALWYGASVWIYRDKRKSIEKQWPILQGELKSFFEWILQPAKGKDKFEFNKTELMEKLAAALKITFNDSNKNTLIRAVNNMALIVASYDGLSKDKIWEASSKIAESYANAWINQSVLDINNNRYIDWTWLSITFFEWIIPIVGIINLKKHKINTYNDSIFEEIKIAENTWKWNEIYRDWLEKFIEDINNNTWSEIKLENDEIIIPKATRTKKNLEIRISWNMEKLVKKNDAGDLILHKDTPIRFFDAYMSDRWRKVLNIWEFSSTKTDKKLDKVQSEIQNDFVTTWEISKEDLPSIIGEPNTENVNRVIEDLNKQIKNQENNSIKGLKVEVNWTTTTFKIGDTEVWVLEDITNQSEIIITKKSDWSLGFEKSENKDQTRLMIQFKWDSETLQGKTEINFDEIDKDESIDINNAISTIYSEGRGITDNLFHNIIHNQTAPKYKFKIDYDWFNENIKSWKYLEAKENLKWILININKYTKDKYNKESFTETRKNIEWLTDEYQLIKVLSAFNVLFSRTANVKIDNKWKYTYRYWEKAVNWIDILKESERRITTNSEKWFEKQFANYRTNTETLTKNNINNLFKSINEKRSGVDFSKQEITRNTIAFNHGNPRDFFKLQINPEIISGFRIWLDKLENIDKQFIEDLKKAYINQLVKEEPHLLDDMLKKAWLETKLDNEQKKQLFSKDWLDLDHKIYRIDFEQNFWYNPECNNLMRLMENVKIKKTENTEIKASINWNNLVVNYAETNSRPNLNTENINIAWWFAKTNKPTTTPGEEDVPTTTPGEDEIPTTTPGEWEPNTPKSWWDGQSGSQWSWRE